jgi:D-sedoheptulose 7-phosphate isomerase
MINQYLEAFSNIVAKTRLTDHAGHSIPEEDAYRAVVEKLERVKAANGTIYLIGNGGSSAIISHAAIDLLNKGHFKTYPVTDNSTLTCLSNDYGYENVFLKVLEKSATSLDALIAMSSSGNSANIVNAARYAAEQKLFVTTFSGFDPANALRSVGAVNFWLDSNDYGKVEIGHSMLLHIVTDMLWV